MPKTLPARVSIETMGNVSNPVFEKGISLPANKNLIFSTAEDNQESIDVHILYGDNTISFDNISVSKYQIGGISKKPRGKPKIELKISIDADMVLTVSTTELNTKNAVVDKKIDLSNITPPPVKYRVVTQGTSSWDDWFQGIGQSSDPKGGDNAPTITDDLERLIYWLSMDAQFRKLYFMEKYKALEGYALTNSQFQALQIITPDIFEVVEMKRILHAILNAETLIKIDPSAKRCDACNGLGFKANKKQTFLGIIATSYDCKKCNGIGFHRTR